MKSSKTILFSLLILIIFAGFSGIINFYSLKIEIREELKLILKSNLKSNDLIILSISQNMEKNLRWVNSGEFVFNGKLYDIISKKKVGNETEYLVLGDSKEESLLKKLNEDYLLGNYTSPKNSKSKHILKFNFKDYHQSNHANWKIMCPTTSIIASPFFLKLPEFYLNSSSPPPKI